MNKNISTPKLVEMLQQSDGIASVVTHKEANRNKNCGGTFRQIDPNDQETLEQIGQEIASNLKLHFGSR